MTLRDVFATCPLDNSALDPDPDDRKLTCRQCSGGLVTEAEVSRVIGEIVHAEPQPLPLEAPRDTEPFRTCPRCTSRMTKHVLYGIQLDRCSEHGLWFDGEEMQRVLHEVGLEEAAKDSKVPLHQKLIGGGFGAAFIAINLIRFIFFLPR